MKDRLQKLIPDKNISFCIFLLPSSMQLCYASSDLFRILAGIQNIEEARERGGREAEREEEAHMLPEASVFT